MRQLKVVSACADRGICYGSLYLDPFEKSVSVDSQQIPLSNGEFNVLRVLLSRRNLVLSKDAILDETALEGTRADLRMVDVWVQRLRRKLAAAGLGEVIASVWGRGYAVFDGGDAPAKTPPSALAVA